MASGPSKEEVVISGFSGKFPICDSIADFEHNLYNGVDMVTVDDSRWPVGLWRLSHRNGKVPTYDRFDADFFKYSKEEVEFSDPQERIALELAFEAIFDSGLNPELLAGSNTGCFVGSCYREEHELIDNIEKVPQPVYLPTRISKYFNLKGPLCYIDTACGSSLSALNEAFDAVKNGICDAAIVIGTNSLCRARLSVGFRDLGMINEDGKCKCLSYDGNGYCRSEAAAALFLQKRSDAKRIYATILNSRSGSDGYKEEGITFPSRSSQTRLVKETVAGCDPPIDVNEITYVEAHCTGTQAGDPVELNALYDALCTTRSVDNPLYVGCLKSNIGHSEGASGLAAVAKAIIVMEKKLIPPNLHYKGPNTKLLGLVDGRQRPVKQITPLTGDIIPVNCFGFGGANTHVLLKRHTQEVDILNKVTGEEPRLVVLSSRTKEGMDMLTSYMENNSSKVTPGFLHLLDSLSTLSSESGMLYKSYRYLVPNPSGGYYHVDMSRGVIQPQVVGRQSTKVYLRVDLAHHVKDIGFRTIGNNARSLINILKSFKTGSRILLEVHKLIQGVKDSFNLILNSFLPDNCVSISSNEEAALTWLITCIGTIGFLKDFILSPIEIECPGSGQNDISWSNLIDGYFTEKMSADGIFRAALLKLQMSGLNGKPKKVWNQNPNSVEIGCGSLFKFGNSVEDDVLEFLANQHISNITTDMCKLYPYQGPVPHGTTFLCNFMKWDHKELHSIKPYCSQWQRIQQKNSTNVNFHFDKRVFDEEFLFDHIIDERVLFPATGYLMMVWAAFTRLRDFSDTPIFDNPIKFSDVHFLTATVMPENKETSFSVKINQDTGSFVVLSDSNPIVTGTVGLAQEIEDVPEIEPSKEAFDLNPRDVYKELRVRGYDYGLLFQGVESVKSDGSSGRVCWRHVVPKNMRANIKKTMNDAAQDVSLWLKNWIPFADSLLQLQIISPSNKSRSLLVPTFVETLICHPRQFNENLATSELINDQVSCDEARVLDIKINPELKTVYTKGLLIKGLKTSQLNRKSQSASVKDYTFCPYSDLSVLSTYSACESLRKEIVEYHDQLNYMKQELKKGNNGLVLSDKFYDFFKYATLHNLLSDSDVNNNDAVNYSVKGDLMYGNYTNIWNTIESTLLENQLDTVILSCLTPDVKTLAVLEVSPSDHILSSSILKLLDLNIYYDQYETNYTLAVPKNQISNIKSCELWSDEIKSQVEWDPEANKVVGNVSPAHLTILNLIQVSIGCESNLVEILTNLMKFNMKEGGFLKVLFKNETSIVESAAQKVGLKLVSKKGLLDQIHPLKSFLFRKVSQQLKFEEQVIIDVGVFNEEIWLPKLQEVLQDIESKPAARVWLRARNEADIDKKFSGVYGLVKTLRLERGASQVRALIDFTPSNRDEDIFNNPKYQKLFESDLMFYVKYDDDKGWGSYVHLAIPQKPFDDPQMVAPADMTYLRMSKPGDLTSFYWSTTNYPYGIENEPEGSTLVDVCYGALNFKDVMYATGGIPPETAPGMSPGDLPLGLEFSGFDLNHNRVMGMVPCRSLASKLLVFDPFFLWSVPKDWSLADAATVPVVYATAYYSLIVRGKMVEGESVLIHAAAGGVGLAALNICIKRKVNIFVTVGSLEKRNFLLKEFPDLNPRHIFNSRSTEFENQLLDVTAGRGVDLVLNCLAGDKLQAGLNVLAPNGRFLEIGKVDFIADTLLYASSQLDENRSFHGILLDSLINSGEPMSKKIHKEREELRDLISNGLISGEIVPLKRTIFDGKSEAEKAFRYLTTGKHIGKVLLKIRDEKLESPLDIPSVKQTNFDPNRAYIVVGALGGLALEVVYWMVQKGARKLVLTSRRGVRDSYQRYSVERLQQIGAEIVLSTIDTTNEIGAEELINLALNKFGTVGGIFSLATTYRDVMFENQSPEIFRTCTESKVHVSYYLDKVSRRLGLNLDYFVCFSSASNGRGNPGQTSYNFANAIMENICAERVKDGLPGVALQWGVIGDVGVIAEQHLASTSDVNLLGSRSQRMASCFSTIDHILQRRDISTCLNLVRSEKGAQSSGICSADLVKSICHIIGIKDISSIEPNTSLGSLGIDSLIAIEIKQTLERTQNLNLSLKQVRDLTVGELQQISSSSSSSTPSDAEQTSSSSQPSS